MAKRTAKRNPSKHGARARSGRRRCRGCGCTDRRACPGGCFWAEYDLCSACALAEFRNRLIETRGGVAVVTDTVDGRHAQLPLYPVGDVPHRAEAIARLSIAAETAPFARCIDAVGFAVMPPPFPDEAEHPADSQLRLSIAAEVFEALSRAGFDVVEGKRRTRHRRDSRRQARDLDRDRVPDPPRTVSGTIH